MNKDNNIYVYEFDGANAMYFYADRDSPHGGVICKVIKDVGPARIFNPGDTLRLKLDDPKIRKIEGGLDG